MDVREIRVVTAQGAEHLQWRMVRRDGFQVDLRWHVSVPNSISVDTYDPRESTVWKPYMTLSVLCDFDASPAELFKAADNAACEWLRVWGPLFV